VQATNWFDQHAEAVVVLPQELSIMNRTLASRTSLWLYGGRTDRISKDYLLAKYRQYRRLYQKKPADSLSWSWPYMQLMQQLMEELLPS
jgi:hypothetical protein